MDVDALHRAIRDRSSANLIHHATQLSRSVSLSPAELRSMRSSWPPVEPRDSAGSLARRRLGRPLGDPVVQRLTHSASNTPDDRPRSLLNTVRDHRARTSRRRQRLPPPIHPSFHHDHHNFPHAARHTPQRVWIVRFNSLNRTTGEYYSPLDSPAHRLLLPPNNLRVSRLHFLTPVVGGATRCRGDGWDESNPERYK